MNRLRRRNLSPWPDPQLSLGEKINTRTKKMKGSSAWFVTGPALDRYEGLIRPQIECILRNVELPEGAPLFLNLYMIARAKKEDKANPIIMVCCINEDIRKQAEASIRESKILDRYPEFGLGSSALPLEAGSLPVPYVGRRLRSHADSDGPESTASGSLSQKRSQTDDGTGLQTARDEQGEERSLKPSELISHEAKPGSAFSGWMEHLVLSPRVEIGRPLTFSSHAFGSPIQQATGGPFIRIGDDLYQLTAAHATHFHNQPHSEDHGVDLDECEFDGQSDEDVDDQVATSRGSLSPETLSQSSDIDSSSLDGQDHQDAPDVLFPSSETTGPEVSSFIITDNELRAGGGIPVKDIESRRADPSPQATNASTVSPTETTFSNQDSGLDYHLVKLSHREAAVASNRISLATFGGLSGRMHRVTDVANAVRFPISIYAMTCRGAIPGNLVGGTSVKTYRSIVFQKMLAVSLSKPLEHGDSGTAIIDAESGVYYGHVVLGVKGDGLAYIVPSTEVFDDIAVRFGRRPTFWLQFRLYSESPLITSNRLKHHHSHVPSPASSSYDSQASSFARRSYCSEASTAGTSVSSQRDTRLPSPPRGHSLADSLVESANGPPRRQSRYVDDPIQRVLSRHFAEPFQTRFSRRHDTLVGSPPIRLSRMLADAPAQQTSEHHGSPPPSGPNEGQGVAKDGKDDQAEDSWTLPKDTWSSW